MKVLNIKVIFLTQEFSASKHSWRCNQQNPGLQFRCYTNGFDGLFYSLVTSVCARITPYVIITCVAIWFMKKCMYAFRLSRTENLSNALYNSIWIIYENILCLLIFDWRKIYSLKILQCLRLSDNPYPMCVALGVL